MKFYRVQLFCDQYTSRGFRYFTTKKDALACKREHETEYDGNTIEDRIEIEPTKRGILKALNRFGGHPDRGSVDG